MTYEIMRSTRGTVGNRLSEAERRFLNHCSMWGTADWPFVKVGRQWIWQFADISSPTVYKTKREAIEAFDRFHDVLLDASGQEAYERAVANG